MAAYTGNDLEGDLARATLSHWASAGLAGFVPGGLQQEPLPATPAMPYATLEIAEGRREDEWTTGQQAQAYRDVAIKIRGLDKGEVIRVAGLVDQRFFDAALPIAGLMRLETLPARPAVKDGKYQGQTIWLAIVRRTVWIHWDRS